MVHSKALAVDQARLTGGFWFERQALARDVTQHAIYDRFYETGRFDALRCDWKEGMPNRPHIFWDSDIAKWIEGVAHLMLGGRDAALEQTIDGLVGQIEKNRMPDGYFNSYFLTVEPEARFTRYHDHELYCLGHWIEAAIAYHIATGKRRLLDLMIDYADLVDGVYRVERSAGYDTPGHQEIELALYKLYRHTGEARFMTLMRHFIDTRGTSEKDWAFDPQNRNRYTQGHMPVRDQQTAEGHAVRAMYLYSAMADQAAEDGDEALLAACRTLFENVTGRRMYITGGIGSTRVGEAFSLDYDLMNRTAYAETCAALGLVLFASRMSAIEPDRRYADAAKLALYNGALAGISLSGDAFFYENPLEMHPELNRHFEGRGVLGAAERQKVFGCSCCPPNILRTIGSIQSYAYTQSADALYAHHFMTGEADTAFGRVVQKTGYPYDGDMHFTLPAGRYTFAARVPGWAKNFQMAVNGQSVDAAVDKGYAYIERQWRAGDCVTLSLSMAVRVLRAHPALHEDCGRVAVMCGPLVYCVEEIDNGRYLKDIAVTPRGDAFERIGGVIPGIPALKTTASRRKVLKSRALYSDEPAERVHETILLVPFFAWGNRGLGAMNIWLLEECL